MTYNPAIHRRRCIRINGYDYSQEGLYFVTICVQSKECLFGKIANGEIELNEYGKIAYNEWLKLPERFLNVMLDVFQIMPNHIHGIIMNMLFAIANRIKILPVILLIIRRTGLMTNVI